MKLSSLIESFEINPQALIEIYDAAGAFVTRGAWFQDHILNFGGFRFFSSKAMTIRSNTMVMTSNAIPNTLFPPSFTIDKWLAFGYPLGEGGRGPLPLLQELADQVDQRSEEWEYSGNKDDGLDGLVFIAASLFPSHWLHGGDSVHDGRR